MGDLSDDREHFVARYAAGEIPWDTGVPSRELLLALDAGELPGPGHSDLDLGCGTGTNAVELARRGYRVTAVDFVPTAIQTARDKAQAANVSVTILEGDVTTIPGSSPPDASPRAWACPLPSPRCLW